MEGWVWYGQRNEFLHVGPLGVTAGIILECYVYGVVFMAYKAQILTKMRNGLDVRWGKRKIYQGKCTWRKKQIKRLSASSNHLVSILTAIFILEMAVFFCRLPLKEKLRFRIINRQQEYKAEWIFPSQAGESGAGDIYGIRICPDTWKLELYHSQDILCPGEYTRPDP